MIDGFNIFCIMVTHLMVSIFIWLFEQALVEVISILDYFLIFRLYLFFLDLKECEAHPESFISTIFIN